MARPMPREPPVTSALRPSSSGTALEADADGFRVVHVDAVRFAQHALDNGRKDASGPELDERLYALPPEEVHGLAPLHRLAYLIHELMADGGFVRCRAGGAVHNH